MTKSASCFPYLTQGAFSSSWVQLNLLDLLRINGHQFFYSLAFKDYGVNFFGFLILFSRTFSLNLVVWRLRSSWALIQVKLETFQLGSSSCDIIGQLNTAQVERFKSW
jgi:hypothetical protein